MACMGNKDIFNVGLVGHESHILLNEQGGITQVGSICCVSVMCHCEGTGLEAILGHKPHILLNKQWGIAQVGSI